MNWKKIGLGLLAVVIVPVVIVLAIAATKPNEMCISRSLTMKAPTAKVMEQIEDFHKWMAWSPYENKDPNLKRTYSGVATGKGAIYEWSGNDDVGQGRMEIYETAPPNQVCINLDFVKPMQGHNVVIFDIEPEGDNSKVSWTMKGESPFMCKVMQVFFNMDEMCGKDFQVGLEKLKKVVEG